jgi:elongation factor Ts
VVEKIAEGKMAKFYEEVCLLGAALHQGPGAALKVIKELIAQKVGKLGENITVRRFARFKVGDCTNWTVLVTPGGTGYFHQAPQGLVRS